MTIGTIYREDISFSHLYAPDNLVLQIIKDEITKKNRQIATTGVNFNHCILIMWDWLTVLVDPKLGETEDLKCTINMSI